MDINKIKLIIWDLDETFWTGTLSEGEVVVNPLCLEIVKQATEKGIVNSICSKNDKQQTLVALSKMGVNQFFVFNSIDWSPKGQRIMKTLKDMGLRAANTLFIDDNVSNINEAEFYNNNLMTLMPSHDNLKSLLEKIQKLETKKSSNSRLDSYKLLEKKVLAKSEFSSNEKFLYSCNLKVELHNDCIQQLDRISELVQRTNQLNYTKLRSSMDELSEIITNDNYQCGYVTVSDNYGEYGIVGFYAIDKQKNQLVHFLFSCRTIGQGVEQYVYSVLGTPKLQVVGDVISMVNASGVPGWINQKETKDKEVHQTRDIRILFKGPCDFMAVTKYIKPQNGVVDTEFTYVGEKNNVIESHNHSLSLKALFEYSEQDKKMLIDECLFMDKDYYHSNLLSKDYDFIFLSTLHEPGMAIYKKNGTELYVPFASAYKPLTDKENWNDYIHGRIYHGMNKFSIKFLSWFSDHYTFVGTSTPDSFIENLEVVTKHLNPKTKIILFLGAELEYKGGNNQLDKDRHILHKQFNYQIRKYVKRHSDRFYIIDSNSYVKDQSDFYDSINHFSLKIYYEIAHDIIELINSTSHQKTLIGRGKIAMLKEAINIKLRDLIRTRFSNTESRTYRLLQGLYRRLRM